MTIATMHVPCEVIVERRSEDIDTNSGAGDGGHDHQLVEG